MPQKHFMPAGIFYWILVSHGKAKKKEEKSLLSDFFQVLVFNLLLFWNLIFQYDMTWSFFYGIHCVSYFLLPLLLLLHFPLKGSFCLVFRQIYPECVTSFCSTQPICSFVLSIVMSLWLLQTPPLVSNASLLFVKKTYLAAKTTSTAASK